MAEKKTVQDYPNLVKEWNHTKNENLIPSQVTYGSTKKIWWICHICQYEWESQARYRTTRGRACPRCADNKPLTVEEFIFRAISKHGKRYDYSKVNYNSGHRHVTIICEHHGEFQQTPNSHLQGRGCPKCGEISRRKNKTKTTNQFILESKAVHGDAYDYSLSRYLGSKKYITIICKIHGEFKQTPGHHIQGKGCDKCGGTYLKTTEEFIRQAKLIHGDLFDYSSCKYVNAKHKIDIMCSKHGIFSQMPGCHLRGNGCPKCKESVGERLVRHYLDSHNLEYKQECSFASLKDKHKLRFDFCVYLNGKRHLIEFHGQQHYDLWTKMFKDKALDVLKNIQRRDKMKEEWAANNNIPLLIIPYWERDNIEQLLDNFLGIFNGEKQIQCQ